MANSGGAGPAVVGIRKGSENLGGSEAEKDNRKEVQQNVPYNHILKSSHSRSSSSTSEGLHRLHPSHARSSSSTGERLHRLHPAHSRKMAESDAHASDRHYPPPAKSTYFSAPRPTSRRAPNVDSSTPPVPILSGQFYGTHAHSSSASSVASIGMAISTAPTSAASTPAPSITGDIIPSEPPRFRGPSIDTSQPSTHSRGASLSERGRASIDTIIPSSNETGVRPQSQAPPARGRRLSKSRSRESSEAERPASANNATKFSAKPIQFAKPSRTATDNLNNEHNPSESKTRNSLSSLLRPEHTGRRLSKDRTESQQTDKKHRWPFFGRKNSNTTS